MQMEINLIFKPLIGIWSKQSQSKKMAQVSTNVVKSRAKCQNFEKVVQWSCRELQDKNVLGKIKWDLDEKWKIVIIANIGFLV
jgi:hypothetical protein